jgi:hypothetical protein
MHCAQRFTGEAPAGFVPIVDAMRLLGVSRQTLLQRGKRGELDAIHVPEDSRKGWRIKVKNPTSDLFDHPESARGVSIPSIGINCVFHVTSTKRYVLLFRSQQACKSKRYSHAIFRS